MAVKSYDVIVVGSGATGGMAAKELCEAGLRVAVIEAGRKLDPESAFTEHKSPFDLPFRGFGQPGIIAREQRSAVTVANMLWRRCAERICRPAPIPRLAPVMRATSE